MSKNTAKSACALLIAAHGTLACLSPSSTFDSGADGADGISSTTCAGQDGDCYAWDDAVGHDAAYVREHALILFSTKTGPDLLDALISTARPDGTDRAQLTPHGAMPSWTPDGGIIFVASDAAGTAQIWLMNEHGEGARQVGDLTAIHRVPVMPQRMVSTASF